jgi:hypothetical protein
MQHFTCLLKEFSQSGEDATYSSYAIHQQQNGIVRTVQRCKASRSNAVISSLLRKNNTTALPWWGGSQIHAVPFFGHPWHETTGPIPIHRPSLRYIFVFSHLEKKLLPPNQQEQFLYDSTTICSVVELFNSMAKAAFAIRIRATNRRARQDYFEPGMFWLYYKRLSAC